MAKREQVFYHRTTAERAERIMKSGFDDESSNGRQSGVWLSDRPISDTSDGDTLVKVYVDLSERELAPYKWVEEGQVYREWCVPADLINPNMRCEIV
jgi:hypothetical protein